MLSYQERSEYFQVVIQCLNEAPLFKDIVLTGLAMEKDGKKNSFWSTTHCSGYREVGNPETLQGEATIYLNLRDLTTQEDMLKAIDHEANHIMPMVRGYYTNLIQRKLT